MAMLPFCGYNMGDYFRHWITMRKLIKYPPRIFHVNWFRKDADGKFLWPGFGENMRVLKWIVDRCNGRANAVETPLGWVPYAKDFDLSGLADYTPEKFDRVQTINYRRLAARGLAAGRAIHENLHAPAEGTDLPARTARGAVVNQITPAAI